MGAFKGGDKLQAALDRIAANASKAASLSVGFLEGATYPDGTSVALVAATDEFGRPSIGQPPRPFFRDMIAAKSGEWPEAVANLLKVNDFDAAKTLGQAGEAIKGQLQQSIADFNRVPLKQSTIDAKGFDKQLIDSSVMINAADFVVK
jgi:hypothetical protein